MTVSALGAFLVLYHKNRRGHLDFSLPLQAFHYQEVDTKSLKTRWEKKMDSQDGGGLKFYGRLVTKEDEKRAGRRLPLFSGFRCLFLSASAPHHEGIN